MIKMLRRLIFAAGLLASLSGFATAGAGETRADLQKGAALYHRYGCYGCHGYSGAGSTSSGPALVDRGFDAAHISAYVRAPRGVMPPYRAAVLGDADLTLIAAYIGALHSTRTVAQLPQLARLLPATTAMPSATLVSATTAAGGDEGRALFGKNCAGCHGADGSGGFGPSLLDEAHKRSAAQIQALILQPPPGMPKLSPMPIAPSQLPALADYVRLLGAKAAH